MFPEIKFSDTISIPTYIFYLSVLFCFLIFYVYRRAQKHGDSIAQALDLGLIMMISGFVGARLLHVFYELPAYYQEDWSRVFRIWEGGFVFYGGFLLAFAACTFYVWRKRISFSHWADFYAPVLALGYGLGRISCFLAGCCYGRSCEMPWAVTFPWDLQQVARHPVQMYSVLWELFVFALLLVFEKKEHFKRQPGFLFWMWMALHSLGRLMMEFYREDFRGESFAGLSISTWISFALLAAALVGMFRARTSVSNAA